MSVLNNARSFGTDVFSLAKGKRLRYSYNANEQQKNPKLMILHNNNGQQTYAICISYLSVHQTLCVCLSHATCVSYYFVGTPLKLV